MSAVAAAIKKVATGPHLSKDLTLEESREAMLEILQGNVDPVRAAVLLIALRMKRETDEENLGLLQAMQQFTTQAQLMCPEVLIMADPFNGYNRHCPVTAFLPAVLAACGLPSLSQGVFEMGPKFGVTHAQVLACCDINTTLSVAKAAEQLNAPNCGWAYLDQAQTSPAVFGLQQLRTLMIKRPSLATLEKMVKPVVAEKTHLMIGFVHKAYPEVLASLADAIQFDSALIVRGIEGGLVPTLRESSNNYQLINHQLVDCPLMPEDFGIEQSTRALLPTTDTPTAAETATLGLAALAGEQGVAFDILVYGAAIALWHCGHHSSPAIAAQQVCEVIASGKAYAHFEQAKL